MKTQRCLRWLIAVAAIVGPSALVHAQDSTLGLLVGAGGVVDDAAKQPAQSSTPAQNDAPPPVEHTGLETLVRDILADFKAFPRRESTWVILGVGGAAALAVHPADANVNRRLVSSGWADNLWKPGHTIGGPALYGVPVALYLGGRYLWAPAKDEPQTNKWSHLGLDLLRAELEEEAIVQVLKFSVRRTRPTAPRTAFRQATRRPRSQSRRSWSAISDTGSHGPPW